MRKSCTHDDRGAGVAAQTHHVTLTRLAPNTTYYFAVVSGATTDDNAGQLYQVRTGPTLSIPAIQTVYGRVLHADGVTPAVGALVSVVLQDGDGQGSLGQSAPLSAFTDGQGYWWLNLGAARTQAGEAYFATTIRGDDRLLVRVWYPLPGHATRGVSVRDLPATLPLELVLRR